MSVLARTLPPHGKARASRGWLVASLLAIAACAPADDRPARWQESAWAASRPALVAFLEELATLSDTRMAREARTALRALPDCPVLGARARAGDPVPGLEAMVCLAPDDPLTREIADAALFFQWAQSPAWRLRGRGVRDAAGWKFAAHWEDPPSAGPLALLVPSANAPGPDRLAASGRLVHVRMRPEGGLDLAALAPPGSQGDRLFRLRSGLFAAAVLAGDFEAAIYEPESVGTAPRVAIALGIRSRATAAPAVERFVADLRTTWSVTPSPLSTPQGDGACLLGLRLLPDFAPCYVTGEDVLWVSWNPASLRQAIAPPPATAASREVGRASLDLRAIETTDGLLARASGVEEAPTPLDWPWDRAELELRRAEDGVQIGFSLRTATPATGRSRGASMKRIALAIGVFLTAAGIGFVSVERAREQWAVIEACEAAQQGRIEHALALTAERVGTDDTGRAAGECRCHALLRAGDPEACIALLETLVNDPEEWIPQPGLSDLLLQRWGEVGRHEEARSLAVSLARAHPEEPFLLQRELEARVVLEPEAAVLADLQTRLPERGSAAARTRVLIAQRHLMRGDAPSAIALLSVPFPPEAESALGLWHDTLGTAQAMNDDLPGTQRAYDAWRAAGGDPSEIAARYLLALSTSGLHDTEIDLLSAFRAALADPKIQADAALAESLAVRLLYTLVASDRAQEALATYDALAGHVPLDGVSRDEIERAELGRRLAEAPEEARTGRLQFTLPAELAGGTLFVSPAPGAAPDADYEARAIRRGAQIRVERPLALAPTRWVARDRDGHTRASGTLVPRPGDTLGVRVESTASAASAPEVPARAPGGDGRRRVALLLLDCGDWAISQYLRTRGDLPVWDSLLASGHRAVLDSDPPLTAAALEALVWPGRRNETSLVGTVYRYGVELAGLESIGTNPFEPLGWFLPESRDLFETLGAGRLRVANLLLAHGGVRAGRHGIVTGPEGRTEPLALGASRRPLRADERDRFPTLASLEGSDLHHIETIAAEFDAAESLLREGRLDVLAMRIEPLDLLTHAHFGEAVRAGQDDGNALLFSVYRYIDARLGALLPTLDADDVLIVASDHGIRTAMEHDRPALFVAQGEGVPVGRAPGQPSLRGIARVIANLAQVETDWPETGIARWTGETHVAEGDAPPEPDEG